MPTPLDLPVSHLTLLHPRRHPPVTCSLLYVAGRNRRRVDPACRLQLPPPHYHAGMSDESCLHLTGFGLFSLAFISHIIHPHPSLGLSDEPCVHLTGFGLCSPALTSHVIPRHPPDASGFEAPARGACTTLRGAISSVFGTRGGLCGVCEKCLASGPQT